MQIKAKEILFVRGRQPSEYVQPGEVIEHDDAKAHLLIDRGAAEAVGAREAAKILKQQEGG